MSLLKSKAGERTPLTLLDRTEAQFDKIMKGKQAANERDRAEIDRSKRERAEEVKKHDALVSQIETITADFVKILGDVRAEERENVKAGSVTEDDLKAGRVNVREFFAAGKRRAEVEKEARERADEKMKKVREIVLGRRLRLYEIRKGIAEIDERISRLYSGLAEHFYFELDAMKKELELAGVMGPGVQAAHNRTREAKNDLAMAAKGAPILHAKQWRVKTIEEAELLELDPIIQEAHLPAFRNYIESIRGLRFAELTINYTPSEFAGRNAGDFWHFIRPEAQARGAKR